MDGGDDRGGVEGLADVEDAGRGRVRRRQVDLDAGDAGGRGRAGGPARRTPPGSGRRSRRTPGPPAAAATAAPGRGTGRCRGSAGPPRGPARTGSPGSAGPGRRAGAVIGDRAGDEAAEPRQGAVRRELAAGAAAARGDHDRCVEVEAHRSTSSSQTTRSPRSTGPSAQARTSRCDAALADHRDRAALAQAGGAGQRLLEGDLAPGAGRLGRLGDGVQRGHRAGGVDDGGARALQHLPDHVGDAAALPDRPVAGHDRDRPGRAPGLQRREQVGLVGAGDQQAHRAVALAQPLGQREQRRRGVPLADQQARHRLGRQRERPPERPGHLQRGAGRLGDQPARCPAPRASTTSSRVAP